MGWAKASDPPAPAPAPRTTVSASPWIPAACVGRGQAHWTGVNIINGSLPPACMHADRDLIVPAAFLDADRRPASPTLGWRTVHSVRPVGAYHGWIRGSRPATARPSRHPSRHRRSQHREYYVA